MKRLLFLSLCATIAAYSSPLPFLEAVQTALDRSPVLDSQREKVQSIKSKNLSSSLYLLPDLSLRATESRAKDTLTDENFSSRSLEAQLNWNLYRFGADSALADSASAQNLSEEIALERTLLEVEEQAIEALVALIQTQSELEIYERQLEIQKRAETIAKKRYQKGLMALEESQKITIDLENDRVRLQEQTVLYEKSKADVKALIGEETIELQWPWKERLNVFQIPETWEPSQTNLSLREARIRSEDSQFQTRSLKRRLLPSLDLSLSAKHENNLQSTQSGNTLSGGLSLTIPLFSRLEDYGQYRSQVHEEARAELQVERVRRDTQSLWASTKRGLEIALESVKVREQTLQISKRLYETGLKRFQQGLIDANELAQDQTRLLDAERFAVQGWASAHNRFSEACHLVGLRVADCLSK